MTDTQPTSWIEHLTALLSDVAHGESGPAAKVTIWPPDDRQNPVLTARKGEIALIVGFKRTAFTADQAAEAVSAYCAAVEGHA